VGSSCFGECSGFGGRFRDFDVEAFKVLGAEGSETVLANAGNEVVIYRYLVAAQCVGLNEWCGDVFQPMREPTFDGPVFARAL
jgi:hypothetical protein